MLFHVFFFREPKIVFYFTAPTFPAVFNMSFEKASPFLTIYLTVGSFKELNKPVEDITFQVTKTTYFASLSLKSFTLEWTLSG